MINLQLKSYLLALCFTATIVPLVLAEYFKRQRRKKFKFHGDTSQKSYDFIFVTPKNRECVAHIKQRNKCGDDCSLMHMEKLIKFFQSASNSIVICVYLFTLRNLAQELIYCRQKRGVRVQIIIDHEMIPCGQLIINEMIDAGIEVRSQSNTSAMLHHKFAVVDYNHQDKQKALFGSLNFSMNALVRNCENVTIVNKDDAVVQQLYEEFEYLWHKEEFKNIQIKS